MRKIILNIMMLEQVEDLTRCGLVMPCGIEVGHHHDVLSVGPKELKFSEIWMKL